MDYSYTDVLVRLTKDEYEYLTEVLNSVYSTLKKLPKNTRTYKFYLLENIVNDYFSK